MVSLKLLSSSEHLRSNHVGVDSGVVQVSSRRGPWVCCRFGLHPANCRWHSGRGDVATCGGIYVSGTNDCFYDRGCGVLWHPCDILLCYHPSFSTGYLEEGPGTQKIKTHGGRLLRYIYLPLFLASPMSMSDMIWPSQLIRHTVYIISVLITWK